MKAAFRYSLLNLYSILNIYSARNVC